MQTAKTLIRLIRVFAGCICILLVLSCRGSNWISVVYSNDSAMSRENLSLGVCDQVRLKQACSASEASYRLEILDIETRGITSILSRQRKQRHWSDCADAQADLCLCCSHVHKTGFLMTWLNCVQKMQKECNQCEPRHEKTCFSHMRTTKVQITCASTQSDQHLYSSLLR